MVSQLRPPKQRSIITYSAIGGGFMAIQDKNIKTEQFCPTLETLLLRVKNQQDEKSWEDFVYYYKRFIYIICQKMGLNHHDCEETVQKVLLKLWDKLPEFEYSEGGRFRGWLCMVTGNTVKDFFRKHKRDSERISGAGDLEIWNPGNAGKPEIEKLMTAEWESYITNLALEAVQKDFSEKVFSIFFELNQGSTATDLSEKYDLPANTIYKHSQRVKARLHAEIRRLHSELN